ncbi:uncharacterized protein LY89DRAFT_254681 [Mollisia scopiformis]|uniref:Uncharacterized protein n=1 Tax=Mollisia scopiformis TaxID=149040 RepID=A0A132BE12_MOLSC|nr:uncharacterized protein LY89DRAFT_254681 [Mollisia scopiformis]KUJ10239.1 hypothetical protein LY89DRAFT_254681 [Mollisia scopiformis]
MTQRLSGHMQHARTVIQARLLLLPGSISSSAYRFLFPCTESWPLAAFQQAVPFIKLQPRPESSLEQHTQDLG